MSTVQEMKIYYQPKGEMPSALPFEYMCAELERIPSAHIQLIHGTEKYIVITIDESHIEKINTIDGVVNVVASTEATEKSFLRSVNITYNGVTPEDYRSLLSKLEELPVTIHTINESLKRVTVTTSEEEISTLKSLPNIIEVK